MEPSLAKAYQNRNWLLTTYVIENILFSAVMLGWPALVSILKSEDYYAHLCTSLNTLPKATVYDLFRNSTQSRSLEMAVPIVGIEHSSLIISSTMQSFNACCNDKRSCPEQEKRLNKCFTLGAFLMNVLNLPIGWTLNKCGAKWIRSIGLLMTCSAFILFAISSASSPYLITCASALVSIGGNIVVYTSLYIANLFGPDKTRSLGLLVGSHAVSAVVFPILKVFYAFGAPLNLLFIILAILSLFALINTCCTAPSIVIPIGVDSLPLGECKPILKEQFQNEKIDDETYKGPNPPLLLDKEMTTSEINTQASILPLHRVIFMPMYLWSVIFVSGTHLRMMFFIGDLNQMLLHSAQNDIETVDLYIFIFGILQVCCLGTTHFIGGFVEWRNKKTVNATTTEQESPLFPPVNQQVNNELPKAFTPNPLVVFMERIDDSKVVSSLVSPAQTHHSRINPTRITVNPDSVEDAVQSTRKSFNHCFVEKTDQISSSVNSTPERKRPNKLIASKIMEKKIEKLKDTATVFFIISILMVIFGLLVLIPSLTIQVSTFVCYTLIRGLIPCAVGRLYSVAFNSIHHQSLIGLLLAISAISSTIQQPLFMIVTDLCDGDPYWVNIGLLIPSLVCFGLPIHLLCHCRNLEQWKDASLTTSISQPVVVKMQYMDNKLSTHLEPTEL